MVKEDYAEPEQMRKLFIGGLDYRTTDDDLKSYFERYGEIVDVVVMKDSKTSRSRGFGFVAFSRAYMVDEAQKDRPHKIDGRTVDTKRAVPRDEITKPEAGATVKKLFVGGLREDVEEDELRDAFQEFGEIVAVTIPTEKETNKQRGFAFIEYEDHDSVDKACIKRDIMIGNKRVDVKKALSRAEMNSQRSRGSGGGGGRDRGGRGNSWGGRNEDSWGNNSNSGWGGNPSPWNNSGNYGSNDGYNQNPWQGGSNQSWGGGNQGWGQGNNGGGYSGGSGGNQYTPWNQGGSGGNFGDNYNQNYGGGPMRNQGGYGQGGSSSRSGPYSSGGGGGNYSSGGGSNRRY